MSQVQAARGVTAIRNIDDQNDHRRRIATCYSRVLADLGIRPPYEPDYATHTFLRYPLLVQGRDAFIRRARRHGLDLGDWFNSPLHPVQHDIHRWAYRWGQNPKAERASRHIVNFPTHAGVSERHLNRACDFLRQHRHELLARD
jgi:dTDP-4-amino-4,6-dideoxygalactose transaminase